MPILKIPSMFKSPKIRRFDFKTRYYDERKERIENVDAVDDLIHTIGKIIYNTK